MHRTDRRMDAAVSMDAKNAPTGTWKTAQNAVSHSAPRPLFEALYEDGTLKTAFAELDALNSKTRQRILGMMSIGSTAEGR